MKNVEWELKVLTGAHVDVQKTINQWKHQFKLKIESCHPCPHKEGESVIYLIRMPK